MKKQVVVLAVKIAFLYLALPVLLVDLILVQTAVPRLVFATQPYLYSASVMFVIAFLIASAIKSKAPIIWTVFFLLYAAVFFSTKSQVVVFGISLSAVTLVIALTYLVATINFLYRNKVTEPLLILLPVCAGAWLYLSFIYQPSLVAWAAFSAGRNDVASVLLGIFGDFSANLVMMAIVVVPLSVLYFLGKHGYVRFYSYALSKIRHYQQPRPE